MASQTLLVVGGNGFVGHAVCKAALRRGWKVRSISKTGKAFATPNGHLPAWTSDVEWHVGSAFEPSTYKHLLRDTTAVVHTLGTLLENSSYKTALKRSDVGGLFSAAANRLKGDNPLAKGSVGSYEHVNRDSAIEVLKTYLSERNTNTPSSSFIYISAEDIFRPVIPARYITTKREAESAIQDLCSSDSLGLRSVFIRPSLIYHPHLRPLTSPLAVLLSASAKFHHGIGSSLPVSPASLLRGISSIANIDSFKSMAHALETPPIHVEHVADAVCASVEDTDVEGPVGVEEMRRLIGWEQLTQPIVSNQS